jgi:hypothetical protein
LGSSVAGGCVEGRLQAVRSTTNKKMRAVNIRDFFAVNMASSPLE